MLKRGDRKGRSRYLKKVKVSESKDAEIDRKWVISGGFLAKWRSKMASFWPEKLGKSHFFCVREVKSGSESGFRAEGGHSVVSYACPGITSRGG